MEAQVKNAIVTGGTDGIGKEIAYGLARAGHRLILVGRDARKGAAVARGLVETCGKGAVRFIQADLSLVSEADRLAWEVATHFPAVHYLVHCAGVVRGWREVTPEGIESNFAINFLSRFTLTQKLLPLLEAAARPGSAARIVIVSGAATNGKIRFEDVNLTKNFGTLRVVSQFCRANDLFTEELPRRLAQEGLNRRITVNCLKIGVVKTNIRKDFPGWMKWLVPLIFDPLLGQTPQQAAYPALGLLLSKKFEGVTGARFLKIRRFSPLSPSTSAKDRQEASRLWELSESLTNEARKQLRVSFFSTTERREAPV